MSRADWRDVPAGGYVLTANRGAARLVRPVQLVRGAGKDRVWLHGGGGGWNAGMGGQCSTGGGEMGGRWNTRSRMNMRYTFAGLPWEEAGPRLVLMTLTLPLDWRSVVPDGEVWRSHRRAFVERWRRAWGSPKGAWIREYQPRVLQPQQYRGAPHLHMYVGLPGGAELKRDRIGRYRWWWASEAWYDIVGSEDRKHLGRGVDVVECFWGKAALAAEEGRINWAHIADYFWRESGKWGQKNAPPDFPHAGRPWAVLGGLKPVERRIVLTKGEGEEVRRVMRALYERRMARARREAGMPPAPARHARGRDGLMVLSDLGPQRWAQLCQWATDVREWKYGPECVRWGGPEAPLTSKSKTA
jgi:hypothetical protein